MLRGMVKRRVAEMAGTIITPVIVTYVAGMITLPQGAAGLDPAAYVIAAVVPVGMILIYWFGIEPRHRAQIKKARRISRGFDAEVTRHYKDNPENTLSTEGQRHEQAPDFERRAVWERAQILDLCEPTPSYDVIALRDKIDEGRGLLARIGTDDPTLKPSIAAWELATEPDVRWYRSARAAARFGRSSVADAPSDLMAIRSLRDKVEAGTRARTCASGSAGGQLVISLRSVQPVHVETMRERCANSVSQRGSATENLGVRLSPASASGLAGARAAFLGRQGRSASLAAHQPAAPTKRDGSGVLGARLGVRLALTGREVNDRLGALVGIAWHAGTLRHGPRLARGDL